MLNFWQEMKKPIFCLAPMADVTDSAFRYVIAKTSKNKPHMTGKSYKSYVTYTEFVSADGLVLAPEAGKKKLLKDLEYSEIERPIVAQLFSSKPEMMEKAAALVAELGFDGVDINMGCPDKSIEKQGAGAALMKNPKLAREIIRAAKRGWEKGMSKKGNASNSAISAAGIPVSVKTRLGYSKDELEEWLPELLAENPAAIIMHARTRKEMSKVPARWERIKRAVEIRDNFFAASISSFRSQDATHISLQELSLPLIIGNGDVKDIKDAMQKCEEAGADGAMFGRAIFGNPWLFANLASVRQSSQIERPAEALAKEDISIQERLKVLLEHTKLFEEKLGGIKSFAIMKKHFREYLKTPELKDLKFKLMRAENAQEVEQIIKNYF